MIALPIQVALISQPSNSEQKERIQRDYLKALSQQLCLSKKEKKYGCMFLTVSCKFNEAKTL